MTTVLPNGYLTILEAAEVLTRPMYAGVTDLPVVSQIRKQGLDVRDGGAMDCAIAEIWIAVDGGTLRAMAIGGRPRQILRLSPELTKGIPTLRSPRGRGFSLLRQSNPAYHQLASWFGPLLHTAVLAFRETEIQKLGRRLMRARRKAEGQEGEGKPRGRPSLMGIVQPVIRNLVVQGAWKPPMGMKSLTRAVNRAGKWSKPASQDTVARALDSLHEATNDRRFERVRHRRRPRRKTGTKAARDNAVA